jgi:hypothetical protein
VNFSPSGIHLIEDFLLSPPVYPFFLSLPSSFSLFGVQAAKIKQKIDWENFLLLFPRKLSRMGVDEEEKEQKGGKQTSLE